jgi:hypothetical protein
MLLSLCLFAVLFTTARHESPTVGREFAFDLWDWTPPCRDLDTFRVWAADLKRIGVTRLEISAPWNVLEPHPGQYDLSFLADRLAVAKSLGLGLRIRINSYYAGATPTWLQCDFWRGPDGKEPFHIPSINDARFWQAYAPLCTTIARRFRGEDILYSPFIGVHAELKWADWWTYDDASLALWRKSLPSPRPSWLRDVVGDAPLPERPPVPPETHGVPDTSAASKAFIAFRQECWREAVRRFVQAIHAGDPQARISVPLGESYRRGSAQMSNLDYYGLSRGAAQVVHSYDFFWHAGQAPWYAGAAVSAFRGITGLPVSFEIDGPNLFDQFHYTESDLLNLADAALEAGAAMKAANYSYSERLPSTWPFLTELGQRAAYAEASPPEAPKSKTILLFVSKWADYCYREPSEWLHDAQFGAWRMLTEHGYAVRFVCEDNLTEDLHGYRGLYVAFSPPALLPEADRRRLEKLCATLPSIVEIAALPSRPAPQWEGEPHLTVQGRQVTVNYPLAYQWLHSSDHAATERLLDQAVSCAWNLSHRLK